ncbi:MAG: peptide chain release factor N(5)-glutamine methyltransferase [Dethiobacteria bacterium]|jgi:release factor glutamine methyltransferase
MLSITVALEKAVSFLRSGGIPFPRAEAELLLAFVLQKDRLYLYSYAETPISPKDEGAFFRLVRRRAARVPLAYLTGEKEFMGLPFAIEEGVLIPRPETELLVEAIISWVGEHHFPGDNKGNELRILDLGTGSGNIGLSLLAHLPSSRVTGIDIDARAIELTRRNAKGLGIENRLELCRGNYWEALGAVKRRFHVIVSNPPYIPTSSLPLLQDEVRQEPRLALDGGEDGLEAYRAIFSGIGAHLDRPGLLALEVGRDQARDICALAEGYPGFFRKPTIKKDYAGIPRLVLLERKA